LHPIDRNFVTIAAKKVYAARGTMKRTQPWDKRDVEMLAVAFLAGEGKKPTAIAETLGINAVAVSRHLKRARKDYLREHVHFVHDSVPRHVMDEVYQRVANKKLQDQVNELAKRHGKQREISVRVFTCGTCSDDLERMTRLGKLAAPLVRNLLLRSQSCGLTWGGSLNGVVMGLRDLPFPPPWTPEPIQCIPLSGEPLTTERASYSSSNLARDLGVIVNGDKYDAPSLAMVPAFVPDEFKPHEREGVWLLIELVKSYYEIFGPHQNGNATPRETKRKTHMAMRLDMILTSVGSHEKPLGFGRGVLFDKISVSARELKSLIVAEVGGVCIPRENLSADQSVQFQSIQTSWTGLRIEHLNACAQRGSDLLKGPPGVVVVSGGKGRATVICELIKRGLINHLIIDEVLAGELESASASTR
jgi:DNA-binding transcriptional regulator LsrR (DeoR family)